MHTDFEGVEAYIRSLPSLSLANTTIPKPQSIEDFLVNLLGTEGKSGYTLTCNTIENEKKMGTWHRRTITDIYRLCLTYVSPDLRLVEVIEKLCGLVASGYYASYICGDIKKRVWWQYGSRHIFGGEKVNDEYDLDYSGFMEKFGISHELEMIKTFGIPPDRIIQYKLA